MFKMMMSSTFTKPFILTYFIYLGTIMVAFTLIPSECPDCTQPLLLLWYLADTFVNPLSPLLFSTFHFLSFPLHLFTQEHSSLLSTLPICPQDLRTSSYLHCKCWGSLLSLYEVATPAHCIESKWVGFVDHCCWSHQKGLWLCAGGDPEPASSTDLPTMEGTSLWLLCPGNWRPSAGLAFFFQVTFSPCCLLVWGP